MSDARKCNGESLPKRVLVCTADVGCGHGRAAAAVTLALRERYPEIETDIVDTLTMAPRWFTTGYRDIYLRACKHLPRLSGWAYHRSDVEKTSRCEGLPIRIESRAMQAFCNSESVRAADVIVCTHFLCARVLSDMRRRGLISARLTIVVTDQHPHAIWRVPFADLFCVASDPAAAEMSHFGFDPSRTLVTGIPIDARFDTPVHKVTARRKHHIPDHARVVLISGGGLGLGGIEDAFEGVLASKQAYPIIVCGKNKTLFDRLIARHGAEFSRGKIIGHTARIHELMAASDILVGKPGGLTSSEAAVMELPMVLLQPLPGQEEHNAAALCKAGMAVFEHDAFEAGRTASAIVGDACLLSRMRRFAQLFGRRGSAQAVAWKRR